MKRFRLLFLPLIFLISFVYNSFATTYAKTTLQKMVQSSTIIIEGRVTKSISKWETDKKSIFTYTTVEVLDVFKGVNVPLELTIRQLGGKVGDKALIIDSNPEFNAGETAILFLVWHQDTWWINSIGMGKFDIEQNQPDGTVSNPRITRDILSTQLKQNSDKVNYPVFLFDEFKNEIKKLSKQRGTGSEN